ncbi:MAG: ferredoxin [Pleurocapsa sp. MO_192.B19]|nr:ferredoxin [Pleurocapsa sp. MO_192.B19]
MTTMTGLTQGESIWKPQFIEEINQDLCLDCDRFYEVGGYNALRSQPMNQDNNNIEPQVMTITNPKQCIDCQACTSSYTEKYYTHYSFSV